MKDDLTEIVVILDRSGSMDALRDDAIGGFNAFIHDQLDVPGDALVTLVQFDHEYECIYSGKPIGEVTMLDGTVYVPRGSTALLDAMGRTINEVGARLAGMDEADRPAKVIVVVITDGYENASVEFTHAKVKDMVELQREKYSWEFVFLAADPTTVQMAQDLSVPAGNVALFANNQAGVRHAYAVSTRAVSSYRSGTGDSTNLADDDDVQ